MEVDNADLIGHGWRPFVDREDETVIGRMLFNAAAGIASRYDLCAEKRNGERLYLEVQTVAVYGPSNEVTTAGRVILHAWESPRSFNIVRAVALLITLGA